MFITWRHLKEFHQWAQKLREKNGSLHIHCELRARYDSTVGCIRLRFFMGGVMGSQHGINGNLQGLDLEY